MMAGDLIEVYKMRGIDQVDAQNLLPRDGESRIRGHRLKIKEKRFNRNLRGNLFHTKGGGCMQQAVKRRQLRLGLSQRL